MLPGRNKSDRGEQGHVIDRNGILPATPRTYKSEHQNRARSSPTRALASNNKKVGVENDPSEFCGHRPTRLRRPKARPPTCPTTLSRSTYLQLLRSRLRGLYLGVPSRVGQDDRRRDVTAPGSGWFRLATSMRHLSLFSRLRFRPSYDDLYPSPSQLTFFLFVHRVLQILSKFPQI